MQESLQGNRELERLKTDRPHSPWSKILEGEEEERKRKGREGSRDLRRRGFFSVNPLPPGYPRMRLPISKKDHIDMKNEMIMENEQEVFFGGGKNPKQNPIPKGRG